jgi:glycosyltransferase involved in cell wall biosynthesis
MIHCQGMVPGMDDFHTPHVHTMHGNEKELSSTEKNVIFVSKNQAERHGVEAFVYNGMDWSDYGSPDLSMPREYFHFLAKAAWRVKNVQGAINAIKATKKEHLKVLGGTRLNFNMGFRWTFTRRASFCGMVGGEEKNQLLRKSKGLIFPVRWHEPFGIAITESLYFGCPVFGTPYGSLNELVTEDFGFLTNNEQELTQAIENSESYSKQACHEYARDSFNSKKMALDYLDCYQRVLDGESLNENVPQPASHGPKYLEWHL